MSKDQMDLGYQPMDVGRDVSGPANKGTARNVTV